MNIKTREKLNKLLEEFTEVCHKNDIWYSLDAGTLLGVVRHGGFIPWHEKLQVMMTPESYMRFERRMADRVIDNYKYNWYPINTPSFIEGRGSFKEDEAFIKIRIIVPTDRKQIRKYHSLSRVIGGLRRKINYKEAINDLASTDHDSFKLIGPIRIDKRHTTSIQAFDHETISMRFNGVKVNVPKNYKKILTDWYGQDYMDATIPKVYNYYPSPVRKVRMKHASKK